MAAEVSVPQLHAYIHVLTPQAMLTLLICGRLHRVGKMLAARFNTGFHSGQIVWLKSNKQDVLRIHMPGRGAWYAYRYVFQNLLHDCSYHCRFINADVLRQCCKAVTPLQVVCQSLMTLISPHLQQHACASPHIQGKKAMLRPVALLQ